VIKHRAFFRGERMKLERFISKEKNHSFDAVVIGGGITGAAVAYDIAARGLSVCLVEKNDFSSGTSSATSKMIHGGLRYLATFELGLVRESLGERRKLENIAPNLVFPIPVMLTTSNVKLTNTRPAIKAAMILYDILSYDKYFTWDKAKRMPLHRFISRETVLNEEPNVKRDGLTGGAVYYDGLSIAPERLTLSFLKSAVSKGAQAANYAEVTSFIKSNDRVTGVVVHDKIKKRDVSITGDIIINCGGPWADILLGIASEVKPEESLRRSEGIHIITKKRVHNHIVGSLTPTGRHFFLIPWRGHSLIGTTDKEYLGSPDEYRVTRESIEELIDDINGSFGNEEKISYNDILFTYGGLRPLVEDQTEEVYQSSRKYEIYDNSDDGLEGLITVEGGKYTTSRNLAEEVGQKVIEKLHRGGKDSHTDEHFLTGSEIPDIESFMKDLQVEYSDFQPETVDYIGYHYGTEARDILEPARKKKNLQEILTHDGEILAEVFHAVKNEMALTLNDILFRRTGIGTVGHPGKKIVKTVAQTAASLLKWDTKEMNRQMKLAENVLAIPE
jgi:glycerol-3-phosphate dehydrogenase